MTTTPWRAVLVGAALAAGLAGCAVPVTRTTRVYEAAPPPVAMAPAVRYGTVGRIEEVQTAAQPSGGGSVLGAVIGGVVGNQFGHGGGRAAATALGVFGGAVVGNSVERAQAAAASSRYFRVFVHFDDGGRAEYDYADLAGLHSGERVRLSGGVLERG
jgi:outer membrane lipoprotein SlyB